ncbi:MAG: gamma-glutamyl-gamma-aminobutyrate hydrolase family protein [Anaerolineae bacterium]|nr:gamma-glutamyl-gamma-aminobutyrate hydrolase family protein [Gemmatimonadaceae bacterium]
MIPVIALTSTTEVIRGASRVRVNAAYTSALEHAGAVPIIFPPLSGADALGADCFSRLLDNVHALVLTGGEDIDPARYHAAAHPLLGPVNIARDATEIALVLAAQARKLPILAICRGIQLLNVALGGTLVQDLATERPGSVDHDPGVGREARVHDVTLEQGSRLAGALGETNIRVNSFHHQALDQVADGLRVVAHAPDGIIEGAEWSDEDWWVLAVQWHPEELTLTPERWDRSLFGALLEQARNFS